MNEKLGGLFDSDDRKNNTLIELNNIQWKRLCNNCIHVSQIRLDTASNIIYYDKMK